MSDEHIRLQSSMQYLPTSLTEVVEHLSPVREVMEVAVWLCADKRIISSYSGDFYDSKNKRFSWDLVLTFVCCGLRF